MKALRLKKNTVKVSKGFTLIELLTSVAIFSAITTVALFNNSKFNSSVLLTNTAYEVALAIRQAQFYGVNIKQSSNTTHTLRYQSGYGVRFVPNAGSFFLFEDVSPDPDNEALPDRVYTNSDVQVENFTLRRGATISKVCVDSCDSSNTLGTGEPLDITFLRPNPDAEIRRNGSGVPYSSARVCVKAPDGTQRKIIVNTTGQISVVSGDATDCN